MTKSAQTSLKIENSGFEIPREITPNLNLRSEIISRCIGDPEYQEKIIELCRRDPIVWINLFAWTNDPKKPERMRIPFILYEDFQDKFIWDLVHAIDEGRDLVIEKTREIGATWLVIYIFVWFWLFHDNSNFRIGSRKEEYVDKIGVLDTLMEKIRFTLRFLPEWMLPAGYLESDHASYMRLINPENKNAIVGESANEHFGSGGRSKAILLDEFSKWEDGPANGAWTSTAQATRCRLVLSTPLGSGCKFGQLCLGTTEKIKKLTLHWTLHPIKAAGAYYLDGEGKTIPLPDHKTAFKIWDQNRQQPSGIIVRSPWYDGECERMSAAEVAQELDIDHAKSGFPFFSIAAVKKQKIWTPYARKNPFSRIPFGRYIEGSISDFDGKFVFIEGGQEPWLKIFEEAQGHMEYVAGGDTAEGLAKGDESFLVIRSKYTRSVAATVSGLYQPDVFARYVWLASKYYNDALEAVENAVFGYAVNRDLESMGGNLYYTRKEETKEGTVETPKRGFTTSERTRPLMLAKAEEEIRKGTCEVRDPKIIAEMETFIRNPKKGGRPEADGSMHDDGVIAFSIAGQVISENPYIPRQENNVNFKQRGLVEKIRARKNAGFAF